MDDELECHILLSIEKPTPRNHKGWTTSSSIARILHKDNLEVKTKCDFMVQDGLLKRVMQERGTRVNGMYEITSKGDKKRINCKESSSQ